LVVQKISLLEIVSTAVLLANVVVVVVDLSRVFHVIDSATLQAAHRRTPAPYGILAVLPTLTRKSIAGPMLPLASLQLLCALLQKPAKIALASHQNSSMLDRFAQGEPPLSSVLASAKIPPRSLAAGALTPWMSTFVLAPTMLPLASPKRC